jgi:hypothetical protein
MTENSIATNEPRVKKAIAHISSMLVPNEAIQNFSVQRRLFALLHRRELVSATTGRLIAIKRGLIGGFTPTDIRWQDVKNAQVRVGIFGSDLTIAALTQPDLAIAGSVRHYKFTGLRKAEAQAVYRICQSQEQAWREKRRLRELEELRAKSGGFQGGTGRAAFAAEAGSPADDLTARLQRAKEMLDKGLISDSEYETIKARVVGEL